MDETQRLGVEHLTGTKLEAVVDKLLVLCGGLPLQHLVAAVTLVGKERMAYVTHVGTYLVGASRFEHTLHQRGVTKPL